MNLKYSILKSIALAFALTIFSLFFAIGTFTPSKSLNLIIVVIAWNVYLAGYMITKGWLPACDDCEMVVLIYVGFYGFVIGQIVYSTLILGGLWLRSNSKEKNAQQLQ